MPLLIKNGRIITADDDYKADIFCADETITRIEKSIDAKKLPKSTEVINAAGKYVLPGFIDPHVHIYLPFMGTYAADDYESASKAALAGGTTTLIEMICPGPKDDPWDAYQTWRAQAKKKAAVDYTFHMSVVRFDAKARPQFKKIVDDGVASFKVFLAYKGALDLSDADLYAAMTFAKELGVITTAHCENAEAVDAMQKQLLAAGKTGPEWHEPSRPIAVEASGVNHLSTFAQLTGAHIYTVHTSCAPAVMQALDARMRGVNIWIESVAPHLVLDKTYAEKPNFEGAKWVMSPPLRDKRHQDTLWSGLRSRIISTVGTDHAPFTPKQKEMGRDAFTKIPNGIPSIEERVDLLHTYGVAAGKLSLNQFVDAGSTSAAKIFGLYPKKGTIKIGSDADLVVYDPKAKGEFKKGYSKADYSAFDGWEKIGKAVAVTVRGQVQAKNGKFVGTIGRGEFLRRDATHG
jgi:dihydropyrimidinase